MNLISNLARGFWEPRRLLISALRQLRVRGSVRGDLEVHAEPIGIFETLASRTGRVHKARTRYFQRDSACTSRYKAACPGDFLACSALLTKTQGDTNALTSVVNVTCPPSCYVGRRTFCQSISYSWSENATAASWQITLVPFFQCFTSSFNKTRVWLEREAHTPWLLLIRHSHGRKRITARKLSQQISSIQRGRAMR